MHSSDLHSAHMRRQSRRPALGTDRPVALTPPLVLLTVLLTMLLTMVVTAFGARPVAPGPEHIVLISPTAYRAPLSSGVATALDATSGQSEGVVCPVGDASAPVCRCDPRPGSGSGDTTRTPVSGPTHHTGCAAGNAASTPSLVTPVAPCVARSVASPRPQADDGKRAAAGCQQILSPPALEEPDSDTGHRRQSAARRTQPDLCRAEYCVSAPHAVGSHGVGGASRPPITPQCPRTGAGSACWPALGVRLGPITLSVGLAASPHPAHLPAARQRPPEGTHTSDTPAYPPQPSGYGCDCGCGPIRVRLSDPAWPNGPVADVSTRIEPVPDNNPHQRTDRVRAGLDQTQCLVHRTTRIAAPGAIEILAPGLDESLAESW